MIKRKIPKNAKYYTKVFSGGGLSSHTYTVYHKTKKGKEKYEQALKKQSPYFSKVGSGKL